MRTCDIAVRDATLQDAEAGAALQRQCWREAYGPIVDRARLDEQLAQPQVWVERWRAAITADAGVRRLLAVDTDGTPAGFVVHGPSRSAGDAETELHGLYVLASWHGRGLGQALLNAVLTDASCSLWVLEDNARARAFYARNGFVPDGTRKVWAPLDAWELRLRRGARPARAT